MDCVASEPRNLADEAKSQHPTEKNHPAGQPSLFVPEGSAEAEKNARSGVLIACHLHDHYYNCKASFPT